MVRLVLAFFLLPITGSSQILDLSPSFPTQEDQVSIIYDATQGNGALAGQTEVYCHTGLITQASTSPTSWQFVQGNWGTPDASVLMNNLGNNLFEITIDIPTFYGYSPGTEVYQLAFVFRNADGSVVGRDSDGSDIYYDIYPINGPLVCAIFNPQNLDLFEIGETFVLNVESNITSNITLYDNGIEIESQSDVTEVFFDFSSVSSGIHEIVSIAQSNGEFAYDTISIMINPEVMTLDPPISKLGANYLNDSTILFKLYGPDKEHVYLIGDFNNWSLSIDYHMNRGTDDATWWIEVSGLAPGQTYGYQYYIDGELKLADPLSELILDPNNDGDIPATTFPNLHPYPEGLTSGFVSLVTPGVSEYDWINDGYEKPENKDLIIYELLVRDFTHDRNYQVLIDTLNYLENLGINAIELMPPGEFENNESWGYNPSFHMALDKYYGTPDKFKEFVDECHSRGIAVIVDMVLNHTFGQSPLLRMYWDASNEKPAQNSPWFNVDCPHEPYCWGYDIDHTTQATKDYIDRVNLFWVDEYHIDGFRFDFTKGFGSGTNNYDSERISLIKRMADTIWSVDPETYIILEHWSGNNEEKELAEYGMMLWGNMTHAYQEGGMGYPNSSNLSNGVYLNRSWSVPHLVTYMESHDEERMMFKNISFGNSINADHDAKDELVALGRMRAAATIFLLQPGPKMIWQFGELGYDISIDDPCRVCNKPVLWEYFEEEKRRELYNVYAALNHLKRNYPTFQTLDVDYSLGGSVKRLRHNHSDMNAITLTNFNIVDQSGIPTFHHTGWWYEYFSGDSIYVDDVNASIQLLPGDFKIYTDVNIGTVNFEFSELGIVQNEYGNIYVFPNPSDEHINIQISNLEYQKVQYQLLDGQGRIVSKEELIPYDGSIQKKINVQSVAPGSYILKITSKDVNYSQIVVVQ